MATETFLDGRVALHCGDCVAVLAQLAANSVDSVVTDPPYHLTSIVKRFGNENAAPAKFGKDGAFARASAGFMGQKWDGGDIAFRPDVWREALRVLKPGGHLIAFGGTRTYHRLACAIEDAGFEIRDTIMWVYGSGFPKSHDVSKGIDRAAGAEREVVGKWNMPGRGKRSEEQKYGLTNDSGVVTAAATDAAKQWSGWGSALKPSHEDVMCAQKPLDRSHYVDTIGSTLMQLWSLLWSMLSVKRAEELSELSPSAFGAECGSAQWNAGDESNIRGALSDRMDMWQFELALISSLNTVSSWAVTWADSWKPENMFTTETELETIIDLRTLSSFLSKITPVCIILDHKLGAWSVVNASNAGRCFNAVVARLRAIHERSAVANAIAKEADDCLDVGASTSVEPCVLARKPLGEATIAANVLRWGTGAMNIDGCRIGTVKNVPASAPKDRVGQTSKGDERGRTMDSTGFNPNIGRWPSNLIHDGSPEVLAVFPESDSPPPYTRKSKTENVIYGDGAGSRPIGHYGNGIGDSGSAARFFYTAKADANDRLGALHPTVKPVDLMRYLVRLVTPPGGIVLDPFAGTGTTGEAAFYEGMRAALIEREPEYQADIRRRMALVMAGPDERARESIKANGKAQGHDDLPLFNTAAE